jgi:putative molybdopterin biosynthesis protein
MKRNIYIDNMPIEKALNQYREMINYKLGTECVPIRHALHRTTSEAIFAKVSSPSYHSAAMDGIALLAEITSTATEKKPVQLSQDDYVSVNTGNPLPNGCDSVIMIEDVVTLDNGSVQIIEPAHAWQHVRVVGEDIAEGEMVIPSYHDIRPMDLGALISAGIQTVKVLKKVTVGVMPTGSEIVTDAEAIQKGFIIDSNSSVLAGLIEDMGGIATRYSPVADDYELLKAHILKALDENDVLLINAGSSAGTKDFTAQIVSELGDVMVHGIAMKPGKPTILGKINGKAVIGIPGYPVSAYFAFETFVKPILYSFMKRVDHPNYHTVTLTQRIVSSLKHEERVRVTLGHVGGKYIATPLNRGAGASMSLVKADAILTIPRAIEGIEAGSEVNVALLKPLSLIENRVSVIGSHDVIIDYIQDYMPLASSHVGSMGGIMAMKRKECHLAPIHLLDPATGEYNHPFVRKYFKSGDVSLIRGVKRLQGLIVKKGNPKNISDFEDLLRPEINFVNRQRGSGTRQLLDYKLKDKDIKPSEINGYERELTTHLGVAVAVASEGIDVGVGIYSAAMTMALDFIPIGYESYDFLVPTALLDNSNIQIFLNYLRSDAFKNIVERLGGYQLENPGDIIKGENHDG